VCQKFNSSTCTGIRNQPSVDCTYVRTESRTRYALRLIPGLSIHGNTDRFSENYVMHTVVFDTNLKVTIISYKGESVYSTRVVQNCLKMARHKFSLINSVPYYGATETGWNGDNKEVMKKEAKFMVIPSSGGPVDWLCTPDKGITKRPRQEKSAMSERYKCSIHIAKYDGKTEVGSWQDFVNIAIICENNRKQQNIVNVIFLHPVARNMVHSFFSVFVRHTFYLPNIL
jgi:hypothetical protein